MKFSLLRVARARADLLTLRAMLVVLVAAGFCASHALDVSAAADTYPDKPVRLIVPFPPGGGVDGAARVVGQRLADALGQQLVIDNRGGSGGIIGAEIAAKAIPDGYTLFFGGSASHGIAPHLYRKLAYDAQRDFSPIVLIGATPYMLVVHPSVPATTVRELIALARARPGELNYASAGSGSTLHLTGEMFKSMAGINIVHVPYKGAVIALNDLLSARVQMTFNPAVVIMPHVKTGRLRALAVTSAKRTLLVPELPTVAEAGVPGFEATGWYGLLGPRGLPPRIVAKLSRATLTVLGERELVERYAMLGIEPLGGTPADFAAHIRSELAKWGKVVRESGARVD
ncbi:MAG: tripartite tricarboxylate transporter substrate binding protein [Candidatus Rokubacteria bacterium]|nr:tripartite tricarboxylate transporter substrate binding protein [Candidatus Rokubacteria bacterium]